MDTLFEVTIYNFSLGIYVAVVFFIVSIAVLKSKPKPMNRFGAWGMLIIASLAIILSFATHLIKFYYLHTNQYIITQGVVSEYSKDAKGNEKFKVGGKNFHIEANSDMSQPIHMPLNLINGESVEVYSNCDDVLKVKRKNK